MNLDDLTLCQLKEIKAMFGGTEKVPSQWPIEVGENYFLRTVTLYYTGKLKAVYPDCIVLSDAAWIADTGRFHQFLKDGLVNEVEPFLDDVIIPLGSVMDMTSWAHALPSSQK